MQPGASTLLVSSYDSASPSLRANSHSPAGRLPPQRALYHVRGVPRLLASRPRGWRYVLSAAGVLAPVGGAGSCACLRRGPGVSRDRAGLPRGPGPFPLAVWAVMPGRVMGVVGWRYVLWTWRDAGAVVGGWFVRPFLARSRR